jgi:hypothetical protein
MLSCKLRCRYPFHFNPPSREIESLPATIPSGSLPSGRPGWKGDEGLGPELPDNLAGSNFEIKSTNETL